jgi:hypothetical protein
MTEQQTYTHDEAVTEAFKAIKAIDAAWTTVLLVNGYSPDEVADIARQVRSLIALALDEQVV